MKFRYPNSACLPRTLKAGHEFRSARRVDASSWNDQVPRMRRPATVLSFVILSACGGGGGGSSGPPNPVPAIQALSPNSSQKGGPAFNLSVIGSNFVSGSSVQWNGTSLPTVVAGSALLTADVPATDVAGPGPDAVTVVNPGPGGGTSNAMSIAVPCVIASPTVASAQTKARVGAYYFDGWSGPLSNYHFNGLP